jgi:mono/diheme cytochrome c family protein
MISARMRVLVLISAAIAVAALTSACGTQKISVAKSDPDYQGAVLFSQRCSGCHTLAYAATHGSAANVRTREITNGPNFDVRCERPVDRVLYAIENGGFSGAIMPQNVVVGQDAREVAKFVADYAGRQAPHIVGITPCTAQQVGTLPPPPSLTTAATGTPTATTTATTGTTPTATTPAAGKKRKK